MLLVIYVGDDWKLERPATEHVDNSYNVWRKELAKYGLQLARGSISWWSAGKMKKYWLMDENGAWQKVTKPVTPTVIEDRCNGFDPVAAAFDYKTLLKKYEIYKAVPTFFNYPEFTDLVDSKLNQAVFFQPYMPQSTLRRPGELVKKINNKPIVLKGLGGSGGKFVQIIEAATHRVTDIQVQQEFINAREGGRLRDARLVFIGDKPSYALRRTAKRTSLYTNFHQGGTLEFVPLSSLTSLVAHAKKIASVFDVFPKKLFSLDFMIDTKSDTPYLIECNAKPGRDVFNNTPAVAKKYFAQLAKHILA